VQLRAVELGVELVRQGIDDKLPAVKQIIADGGLKPEQVCYIGDDLPDLPVLRYVGMAVAVGDGSEELQRTAHYVTKSHGGRGALREVIELILKAQGLWDDIVRKYGG
jgi:YrbI family 3-deoxy-D-manno-octulosonate 8-phosphate phosphatase